MFIKTLLTYCYTGWAAKVFVVGCMWLMGHEFVTWLLQRTGPAIPFEDDGASITNVIPKSVVERVPLGSLWDTQAMAEKDAHGKSTSLFLYPHGVGPSLSILPVQSVWESRTLASSGSLLEIHNLGLYPRAY